MSLQIHLLEDTSTLKISLTHDAGVWCEEIVVPELKLLRDDTEDDHLVIDIQQRPRKSGELKNKLATLTNTDFVPYYRLDQREKRWV